jgi:hypothetical protein
MKTITFILVCIFCIASCAEDTSLNKTCPQTCYAVYTDNYKDPWLVDNNQDFYPRLQAIREKEGVGTCRAGTPVCDEDFNIIDCQGAVYPERTDWCDGLDNDCNGTVDDGYIPAKASLWNENSHGPFPCVSNKGVCRQTDISCQNGRLNCSYPEPYEQEETRCDLIDNDCDGLTDETLFESCINFDGSVGPCSCYSGPVGSNKPPCMAGFLQCRFGNVVCTGEVLPTTESCDGVDNDCNGVVDDTDATLNKDRDIVFVIDNSGSMCQEISALHTALSNFTLQFADNPHYRFAIVTTSGSGPWGIGMPTVISNFQDFVTTQAQIGGLNCNGSGAEASIDAIHQVCSVGNILGLNWRPDAERLMFLFSDEPPQSYSSPITLMSEAESECILSSTKTYIWGEGDPDYAHVAGMTGGLYFSMSSQPNTLLTNMNEIVEAICE